MSIKKSIMFFNIYWLFAFAPHTNAYEKAHLAVDAFLECRAEVGYVLFFRLSNLGTEEIELPEDLLPWSPSAFAMELRLKPDDSAAIQRAGIMADSWGRIELQPQQELIGDVRLSLLFPSRQVDAALAVGDARLHWKYSVVLKGKKLQPVDGEIRLLGKSFYEKCKRGL